MTFEQKLIQFLAKGDDLPVIRNFTPILPAKYAILQPTIFIQLK